MKDCDHDNCIRYKGGYLKDQTCWVGTRNGELDMFNRESVLYPLETIFIVFCVVLKITQSHNVGNECLWINLTFETQLCVSCKGNTCAITVALAGMQDLAHAITTLCTCLYTQFL